MKPSTTQPAEFMDDLEEQTATATLIRDDQIDFLDNEHGVDGYRDEFTDDEDNVFRYGDGDEEEGAIGLDKQNVQRGRARHAIGHGKVKRIASAWRSFTRGRYA